MTQRSIKHHDVPIWLLNNFRSGESERLWIGFRDTRKVESITPGNVFFRNNGNTRIDYIDDGDGEIKRVRSDRDEKILAVFDDRMSGMTKKLLRWARQLPRSDNLSGALSQDVVDDCKALIVGQARRTHESQNRNGLTQGLEDLAWDLYRKRAEELGFALGTREDLARDPRIQEVFLALEQNNRANFASGDHSILKEKETQFLRGTGLQVAVIASSSPRFVIGNQGITILKERTGEVSWLPLAPDVAISLTSRPNSYDIGIASDSFVERHNKSALGMSRMVAGNSKQLIEDLLADSAENDTDGQIV